MKTLQDETAFEFLSGLWTGKKPPFSRAVVIRNTNFRDDGKIDYSKTAVLEVEAKQLKTRKLQSGDIIIERSGGGPKQPVGRVVYFDNDSIDTAYSFSNFTSAIRVKDRNSFDPRYVFYFLHNFYREGKTDNLQRRTTGIRNLDFQAYKEAVVFPEINLTEQKAIALVLTTVQTAISEQERLIAKLKELKRSMMHHLFTHGTKGEKTKITEIGEIPESWEVVKLGTVCGFSGGTQPPKSTFKYTPQAGYVRLLQIRDFQTSQKAVYIPDDKKWRKVKSDDVLIGRYGASVGKILRGLEGAINVAIMKTEPDEARLLKKYLYFVLNYGTFQSFITSIGGRSAQAGFNQGEVGSFEIPLPQLHEQQNIAEVLDRVEQRITVLGQKVAIYEALFKTLLHALVTGERRMKI